MSAADDPPDSSAVVAYFRALQDAICGELEALESGAKFAEDAWRYERDDGGKLHGDGVTRVIENGAIFEKGGVNFSHIRGASLPESASAGRAIADQPFEAAGVSAVLHPRNPFVPACHLNVRFFRADSDDDAPVWWFGGGYDLTPCYGFDDDCAHWHQTAKRACDRFDAQHYPRFKTWCDEYFRLKHRDESRGIGGIFFDDFRTGGFTRAFEFVRAIGDSFMEAYRPIVHRRRDMLYDKSHREFQCRRRGRYVEFKPRLRPRHAIRFGIRRTHRVHINVATAVGQLALSITDANG